MQYAKPDPSPTGAAPRSALWTWFYILTLMPCVIVSLFAPDNVIDLVPIIAGFVSLLTDWVPSVERLAAVSAFPQVTSLVVALVWSVAPFQVFYVLNSPNFRLNINQTQVRPIVFGVGVVFLSAGFISMLYLMKDFSADDMTAGTWGAAALRSVSSSRFVLAFAAITMSTFLAILFAALVLYFRHLITLLNNRART